jgi:hypothetical protein
MMKLMYILFCILNIMLINPLWCALQSKELMLSPAHKEVLLPLMKKHATFEEVVPEIKRLCAENPLHWAPVISHYTGTKELIEIAAQEFGSPGVLAVFLGTPPAIEYGKHYIAQNPQARDSLRRLLVTVAEWEHEELLWENEDLCVAKSILAMGVSVKNDQDLGIAAISAAIHAGKPELVELLLQAGVNVNLRFPDEGTFGMLAAYLGKEDILRLLIRCGADLNATDWVGNTSFSLADKKGHFGIKTILAHYGVSSMQALCLTSCDTTEKVCCTESKHDIEMIDC